MDETVVAVLLGGAPHPTTARVVLLVPFQSFQGETNQSEHIGGLGIEV